MEFEQKPADRAEAAGVAAGSAPGAPGDAQNVMQSQGPTDSGDSDMTDSHDENSQDPKGSRTKRTPKQQQQNAQAQKRYRMRRKAKVQEMEQAVEVLTRKLQDQATLQNQNYFLANKVGQLEQAIQDKNAEISQLTEALSKHKAAPVAIQREGGAAREGVKQEAEDLKKSFCDSVEGLKEFITQCNLRNNNIDATGKLVPQPILVQCKALVQNAARVCMSAMSTETPAVLELIGKDPARQNTIDSQIDRSRWLQVVAAMRLTDDQVECILRLRREQLRKLRSLHQERCNLNQRVLEALAADRSAPAPNGTIALAPVKVVEAHMHNLSLNGYLYAVKAVLELHRLLDAVRDNLREEERVVQELTFFLVQHILSPIQAAILFVDAFPFQCDALALANALAIAARGEEESGSSSSLHSGDEGSVDGGDRHTGPQASMGAAQGRASLARYGGGRDVDAQQ